MRSEPEFIEEEKITECEFKLVLEENGQEITYKCPQAPEGIIRCKHVCRRHFKKLKQDNIYRINKEIDIPEDTSMIMKDKRIKSGLVKE